MNVYEQAARKFGPMGIVHAGYACICGHSHYTSSTAGKPARPQCPWCPCRDFVEWGN